MPRFARNSISPVGGTAVEATGSKASPVLALLFAALVGGGIIAWFAMHKHGSGVSQAAPAPDVTAQPAPDVAAPAPAPSIAAPTTTNAVPVTVHADEVATALSARLKKQRLWSTVSITGDHVEVRSSSCADPQMKPTIETSAPSFHAAGLTKLRCVEQSGGVVFARDL